jgi:HK97 family phage prohead protease
VTGLLYRAVPPTVVDLTTEGRTLTGLALPFDKASLVQDPGGPEYWEEFAPASADVSLRQTKEPWPVFSYHDWREGGIPIGVTDLARSSDGLVFRATLSATHKADEALALVNDGAMRDVSLGFKPHKQSTYRGRRGPVTRRTEIEPRELSLAPTGFGMHVGAKVLAVRAAVAVADVRARRAAIAEMTANLERMERLDARRNDRDRVRAGTLTRAEYDRRWYGADLVDNIRRGS